MYQGANRDYLILGSDSGKITILEFNAAKVRSLIALFCTKYHLTICRTNLRRYSKKPLVRAVVVASFQVSRSLLILAVVP